MHPHEQLSPADNRCLNCGASGHSMQECDKPSKPVPKLPGNPKAFSADSEATPKAPAKAAGAAKRKPKGRKLEAAPDAGLASGESATFESEANIEKMLKAITCDFQEPHMIATIKGISVGQTRGLLDGGATHSLRYAAPSEYKLARPVQVHLASGSTFDLRMNAVGTLLSSDPDVQPIVPMGLLAEELKCVITWKGKDCKVVHPELGKLGAVVSRGLQEKLQSWFPEVPEGIMSRLLLRRAYTPAQSGLNRHCRRRLEPGSSCVHLFSGVQKNHHPRGVPAVYLDLLAGHDLRDDALFAYLLQLAAKGKIRFWLAGPPCRTVSALRQRGNGETADGGPLSGIGEERFGIRDLNPSATPASPRGYLATPEDCHPGGG